MGFVELGSESLGAFEALGLWRLLGVKGLERCPKTGVEMQVVLYSQVSFIKFDIVPKFIT